MEIDPIGAISGRAAANALAELTRQARIISNRVIAHSNYLKELGESIGKSEPNRVRNQEFFEMMNRNLPGSHASKMGRG